MASRRMFSKSITETDAFLDMPASSRALYFHLGMNADDDGFVDSPRRIMRASGATEDDMRVLVSKRYVILFDTGIVVIRHWKMHNYIQKDRYRKTIYEHERSFLDVTRTKEYVLMGETEALAVSPACIQDVSNMDSQDRLGKDRLGKENTLSGKPDHSDLVDQVVEYLNEKAGKGFKASSKSTARHIKARIADGFTLDDFKQVIDTKVAQWRNNPDMNKYLRPQTLFGPKFEGYLNEREVLRDEYAEYNC